MPTADATLLPPPSRDDLDDGAEGAPHSARSLSAIGAYAVLGAMIEHRRASQPCMESVVVPSAGREAASDEEAIERQGRPPVASEVFLKAR